MTDETLPNGLRVPKIGFGCWKIGGGGTAMMKASWMLCRLP